MITKKQLEKMREGLEKYRAKKRRSEAIHSGIMAARYNREVEKPANKLYKKIKFNKNKLKKMDLSELGKILKEYENKKNIFEDAYDDVISDITDAIDEKKEENFRLEMEREKKQLKKVI